MLIVFRALLFYVSHQRCVFYDYVLHVVAVCCMVLHVFANPYMLCSLSLSVYCHVVLVLLVVVFGVVHVRCFVVYVLLSVFGVVACS